MVNKEDNNTIQYNTIQYNTILYFNSLYSLWNSFNAVYSADFECAS